MRHHNVGAGSSHRFCVVSIKTIGSRHQLYFMSQTDHIDLQTVAHTGFFQVLAEQPVNQTDRREILYSREAGLRHLLKKQRHLPKPIRSANTGKDGGVLDDSQDFARHFDDDRVCVSIWHQAGQRATPGHPVSTAIINNDKGNSARLFEFCRVSGPSSSSNDRTLFLDDFLQPLQNLLSSESHKLIQQKEGIGRWDDFTLKYIGPKRVPAFAKLTRGSFRQL